MKFGTQCSRCGKIHGGIDARNCTRCGTAMTPLFNTVSMDDGTDPDDNSRGDIVGDDSPISDDENTEIFEDDLILEDDDVEEIILGEI